MAAASAIQEAHAAAFAASSHASVPEHRGATVEGRNSWIQAGLALEVTTGVVAPYLDRKFKEFHDAILASYPGGPDAAATDAAKGPTLHSPQCKKQAHKVTAVPRTCSNCLADMPLMPQRQLADDFVARHGAQNPKLTWTNANATKWGTQGCHIEMAKLYSPKLGDHIHAITKTDFSRLDGTALFNMLRWYKPRAGQPGFPLNVRGAAKDATDARNLWGHEGAATLSLDEAELASVMDSLKSLLRILESDAGPKPNTFTAALEKIDMITNTRYVVASSDHLQTTLDRLANTARQLQIYHEQHLAELQADHRRELDSMAQAHDSERDALVKEMREREMEMARLTEIRDKFEQELNDAKDIKAWVERAIQAEGARVSSEVADVHASVRSIHAGVRDLATSQNQLAHNQTTLSGGLNHAFAVISAMLGRIEEGVQGLNEGPHSASRAIERSTVTPNPACVFGRQVPPTSHFFAGRIAELGHLTQMMHHHPVGAIVGLGGGGKTQLMLHYAETVVHAHSGNVFWVVGDTLDGLAQELAHVAAFLGRPLANRPSLESAAVAAFTALSERAGQWLVCVDNVDDRDVLNQLAAVVARLRVFAEGAGSIGRMLITSRHHDDSLWHKFGVCTAGPGGSGEAGMRSSLLELGPLVGVESEVALCRCRFGMPTSTFSFVDVEAKIATLPAEEAGALRVLAGAEHEFSLGGLPLALQQAGAYMATHRVSFVDYLDLFKKQFDKRDTERVLSPAPDRGGAPEDADAATSRHKMHTTWALNVACLPPEVLRVLNAAALYGPDAMPKELLVALAERCMNREAGSAAHPNEYTGGGGDDAASVLAFNDIVHNHLVNGASLLSASLQGDFFSMHRMVRMFVLERDERERSWSLELPNTHRDALWALGTVADRCCGGLKTPWYLRATADRDFGRNLFEHMISLISRVRQVRERQSIIVGQTMEKLAKNEPDVVESVFALAFFHAEVVKGSIFAEAGIPTATSDVLKQVIATGKERVGADSVTVRAKMVELTAVELCRGAFQAATGLAKDLLASNQAESSTDTTDPLLWWCENVVGTAVHGCELRRDAKSEDDRLYAMGTFAAARAALQRIPLPAGVTEHRRVLTEAVSNVIWMVGIYHCNPRAETLEYTVVVDMFTDFITFVRRLHAANYVDVDYVSEASVRVWMSMLLCFPTSDFDGQVNTLVDEHFAMLKDHHGTVVAVVAVATEHILIAAELFKQGIYGRSVRVVSVDFPVWLAMTIGATPASGPSAAVCFWVFVGAIGLAWSLRRGSHV